MNTYVIQQMVVILTGLKVRCKVGKIFGVVVGAAALHHVGHGVHQVLVVLLVVTVVTVSLTVLVSQGRA